MAPNMNNNKKSRMMPINQQNFNFMKNNPMNNQQPGNGPINNQIGMQGGFPQSCDMNNPEGNMMWNQGNQHQMSMDPLANNGPGLDPLLNDSIESLVGDPLGPNSQSNQINNAHQSPMGGNICMDPTSPSIPSLQGVKVPDEDLTPQQRSQRAMKLAQLQELKQMFKQEPQSMNPNECQINEQPDTPGNGAGPCVKINQMGPNVINPMMQGAMMQGGNPHGPMNGPMRPNFPMGMGPRPPNMCRPMGPNTMGPGGMNSNPMNDEMMIGPGMGNPMGGPMNTSNMQMGPGGAMMGNMNMPPHMQSGNNMGMNNMGPGNCNMNNMNNMNNMGPGGPNMGMMGQKGMPPQMMGPGNMQAHMEWNKLQQQYYDESKRKGGPMCGPMDMNSDPSLMGPMGRQMPPGAMRNMPNMRGPGQGPPPPYHQTPRSASVPIATQSPNPNSPNNPTSNLSLPSPRGGCNSTLNSPAGGDPTRPMNTPHINMKHMNPRQSPTTSQDSPAGTIGRQINHSNPSTPISSHLSPSASLKDLEMSNNPSKNKKNVLSNIL
jgi:B-cell CLL/lymphoma 9 protein